MTVYAEAIDRRFGDGGPAGGEGDNDFIRRVLARKTVRRYTDVVPDQGLLDLLVAAALSASAKSDFQQASILRVDDPAKRAAMRGVVPMTRWIALSCASLATICSPPASASAATPPSATGHAS